MESKGSGKARATKDLIFEVGIGLSALAILCASIYALADHRIALRFIQQNSEGHEVLGQAYRVDGDVRRKLADDLLWLPLDRNARIFVGDSVYCSDNCNVAVRLSTNQDLELSMNSLVRFELREQRPLVTVLRGSFKVNSPGDTGLTVQTARESIESPPAPHHSSKPDSHADSTQPESAASEAAAGADPGEDPSTSASATVAATQATEAQKPVAQKSEALGKTGPMKIMQFPYPANQTRVLHSGAGVITLAPIAHCEQSCRLSVSGAGFNLDQQFSAGAAPAVALHVSRRVQGEVKWALANGTHKLNGSFNLAPFSEDEFAKALTEGTPIEILGE